MFASMEIKQLAQTIQQNTVDQREVSHTVAALVVKSADKTLGLCDAPHCTKQLNLLKTEKKVQ